MFSWLKDTEGVSVSSRCPVGIEAARRGTVNSRQLLPLMKNAALSVSDSICVSTSKCSGTSCFACNLHLLCISVKPYFPPWFDVWVGLKFFFNNLLHLCIL